MTYPRLWARVYNAPLLIHPEKAKVIEQVFRSHLEGTGRARLMDDDAPEETAEQRAEREHQRRTVAYAGIQLQRRNDKPYALTMSGIALIPVLGTLVQRGSWLDAMSGLTSYDLVASMLDRSMADPDVRAVMFEVDSPGGEAYGLADLSDRVFAARSKKPIWAHANEQAYSAGYWFLSSAARAYTPQTGGVGSIGAVMLHVDQSKRDAMSGYAYTFIYSGARKVDGNSHEPLNKPALERAQLEVDRLRGLFAAAVAKHRGISAEAALATEAALLTPAEAVDGKYVDGVSTLLETVALLEREVQQPGSTGARMSAGRTSRETTMKPKQEGAAAEQPAAAAEAKHTDAQLEAARVEARAEGEKSGEAKGHAEGVKAERTRVGAILGCEEAKGRTGLALHLALQTDTDVEAAKKLLAVASKETGGSFAQAMAGLGNPKVGADADRDATEPTKIDTTSIYASRRQARAAAQ